MSYSSFAKTSASSSGRSHSRRRHSYTDYNDREMQNAFRRSLASIHLDCTSGGMSRSNHHPMANHFDSSSRRVVNSSQSQEETVNLAHCRPRRAGMVDRSSSTESQKVSEYYPRSTILEKDNVSSQGILRPPSEFYGILVHRLFKSCNF
jgi:hypothetical protein